MSTISKNFKKYFKSSNSAINLLGHKAKCLFTPWVSVCFEILFVYTAGKVSDSGEKLSVPDLFWDVEIRPSHFTECHDEGVVIEHKGTGSCLGQFCFQTLELLTKHGPHGFTQSSLDQG